MEKLKVPYLLSWLLYDKFFSKGSLDFHKNVSIVKLPEIWVLGLKLAFRGLILLVKKHCNCLHVFLNNNNNNNVTMYIGRAYYN